MSWNANGWNSDSSLMPSENQGPYDLGLTQNPWKTQQTQAGCGTSYQSWKDRNLSSSVWSADNQTNSQPDVGMHDCSGNGQGYPQGQGQHCDNNPRRGPHMQGNTQHRYSDGSQYQPKNPRYQSPQNSPQQYTKQEQEFPNQETYSQTASRFSFVKRETARSENRPSQPQSRPVMSNGTSQKRLMRLSSRPIANQSWNQPRQNWIPPAGNRVCGPRFQQGPRGVITSDWRNQGSCPQSENKPSISRQNQKLSSHKLGTQYGFTGPLSKAAEKSLRVISCTAEGIHYWINSLGDSNPLIFEVFGMVNGLDYFENKIVFLIKGKAVSLQCNFYCMDQDVPTIVNGDSVRVIGRFDMKAGQFQCISVRQATGDEKSHAMKFVQGYSKSLQRFDMSKNEY